VITATAWEGGVGAVATGETVGCCGACSAGSPISVRTKANVMHSIHAAQSNQTERGENLWYKRYHTVHSYKNI